MQRFSARALGEGRRKLKHGTGAEHAKGAEAKPAGKLLGKLKSAATKVKLIAKLSG